MARFGRYDMCACACGAVCSVCVEEEEEELNSSQVS